MSNKCVKYGALGTGYISTPSFAIPNTGILTIEAWMKSKINATIAQTIASDAGASDTIGYIFMLRRANTNDLIYQYASGAGRPELAGNNLFQDFDNQ
jgi:hypothetical protein